MLEIKKTKLEATLFITDAVQLPFRRRKRRNLAQPGRCVTFRQKSLFASILYVLRRFPGHISGYVMNWGGNDWFFHPRRHVGAGESAFAKNEQFPNKKPPER